MKRQSLRILTKAFATSVVAVAGTNFTISEAIVAGIVADIAWVAIPFGCRADQLVAKSVAQSALPR